MTYNTKLFEAALQRFLIEPTTLTDDDLAQFAVVDVHLAERARAKRAGFVEAETEAERNALARPATWRDLREWHRDTIAPVLATYRHKYALLEHENVLLTERCLALEQRVLELEAQRVIADVHANP